MSSSLDSSLRTFLPCLLALTLIVSPAGADGEPEATCGGEELAWIEQMVHEAGERGWLGFGYEHSIRHPGHFTVNYIHSESAAEAAGLRKGDVLVGIGDLYFDNGDFALAQSQLAGAASQLGPGQTATFHILRDGGREELELTLLPHRSHALASFIGWRALDRYYRQHPSALTDR